MIVLDQTLTAALGVLSLLLGRFFNGKIRVLSRVCIPAPVTGGLVVSLLTLALKSFAGIEFSFDFTIRDICMLIFFTSIGFQCDLSTIKKGGRPLVSLIVLVAVLIVAQNFLAVGIAAAMNLEPVFGMVAGSVSMCGGHGTSAGFTDLMEKSGIINAGSIMMATATFGLIAGSLIGGPIAEILITRRGLAPVVIDSGDMTEVNGERNDESPDARMRGYTLATFEIFLTIGLGTLAGKLLSLTGISFPSYFGAMLCAIVIRNVADAVPGGAGIHAKEIGRIGSLCLALFLGIAMCSLRLWELAGLALPLCLMLLSQVVFIFLFSIFIAFPLLGCDYNAAVLVSGLCGFGLGATPNAMANMSSVCSRHGYINLPFIVVPIVGAAVLDIINITVISLFINFI